MLAKGRRNRPTRTGGARAAGRRVAQVLYSEGPLSLWMRILGETVYQRLLLLELWVDRPPTWLGADATVAFGLLSVAQLDEYVGATARCRG